MPVWPVLLLPIRGCAPSNSTRLRMRLLPFSLGALTSRCPLHASASALHLHISVEGLLTLLKVCIHGSPPPGKFRIRQTLQPVVLSAKRLTNLHRKLWRRTEGHHLWGAPLSQPPAEESCALLDSSLFFWKFNTREKLQIISTLMLLFHLKRWNCERRSGNSGGSRT